MRTASVMLAAAVALVGISSAVVQAQSAASDAAAHPSQGQKIVVTGQRNRRDPVSAFVEAVTVEIDDQIAKFAVPVCPLSLGLRPEQNAFIEARLRLIAGYLGIGAAAAGCRPNMVVIAADSGGDFISRLHDERPVLFEMFEAIDIRRIMRQPGPARAWQSVETRGADGRPMLGVEVDRETRRVRPAITGVMPSITSRSTRQDLTLSFVVLDVEVLDGLTPLQIADYAAMRALARTEAATLPSGRSILTLFADRRAGVAPAPSLTDWDEAYLTGLYRTHNVVSAHQQRSAIAGFMRRDLGSQ